MAVQLSMMYAADRDREFVADLGADRPWLCEPQVVRVGWEAATDEARLSGDELPVVLVP
jgi:hypothetical protein